MSKDPVKLEREQAWVGDAVLGLYARSWLLRQGRFDALEYSEFTCNQSLAALGSPTSIEAGIGRLYETEGLEAAFAWIEQHILPLHEKRIAAKSRRQRRHR